MSQPKPPSVEVTPSREKVVSSLVPVSSLEGLRQFALNTGNRAAAAEDSRNLALAQLVGQDAPPPRMGTDPATGGTLSGAFDGRVFYDPEVNPYLKDEIMTAMRRRENRRERRRERRREDDEEMNNIFGMSRQGYLAALGKANRSVNS